MTSRPLRANRDFQLLWVGQALSALGSHASLIALPLFILTATGSATHAGLAGFFGSAAAMAVRLPGGALADRCSRRNVMLGCDLGCCAVMVMLAVTVMTGTASLPLILVVATVNGALSSLFAPAAVAALRCVVAAEHLPSAVASNQARAAATRLGGPPLGGFLFGLSHSLPFLANAVSYAASFVCVLLVRTPLATRRAEREKISLRDVVAGLPFLWGQPFLRDTLAIAAVLNFTFSGILLAVITVSVGQGSSSLSTGVIVAFAGLGSLVGALLAPKVQRMVAPRQILLGICWTAAALVPIMAVYPTTVVLGAVLAVCVVLIPIANVMIITSRILLTPDHLQGRVYSAAVCVSVAGEPLGLLLAGVLLDHLGTSTFLVFAGLLAPLALGSTFSKGLKQAPTPGAYVT